MSDWFVKQIIYPSKHITLVVLLNFLKKAVMIADSDTENDFMPIVEIVLDDVRYLLIKEKDFTERFGE